MPHDLGLLFRLEGEGISFNGPMGIIKQKGRDVRLDEAVEDMESVQDDRESEIVGLGKAAYFSPDDLGVPPVPVSIGMGGIDQDSPDSFFLNGNRE